MLQYNEQFQLNINVMSMNMPTIINYVPDIRHPC